jgi:hypothetical protein
MSSIENYWYYNKWYTSMDQIKLVWEKASKSVHFLVRMMRGREAWHPMKRWYKEKTENSVLGAYSESIP